MDKIEQCVSDVVAIANGARDHEQAKARIKELLDDAKFQLGQGSAPRIGSAISSARSITTSRPSP